MLVLTRKPGEKIIIEHHGQTITVSICSVDGNKVRVGIEAPKSVRVDREEVHERRHADTHEFAHG